MSSCLSVAKSLQKHASKDLGLMASMANRHGLVAGATGTGKTVSLRVLAEQFSRAGVPVFMADIKGDLSGLALPGADNPKFQERRAKLQMEEQAFEGFPVIFWDCFGQAGHPVRTTISEMGPLLLSRLLGLNETQSGLMNLVFKVADENGLLLLDIKDLRAMLGFVLEKASELRATYGNVSAASVGAIQRSLLELESQGGDRFFGEPALNIEDLLQTDSKGRGVVHILASDKLVMRPKFYATFLLWLLSELYESLPEVGDCDKPKLVFFFDEAHLLFYDAPTVLLERIEQVVRLVRSKGVGIYFCTQNPIDIPDTVLGQLGNRIQHALRAYTPKDQKAVKAAATTFRANPELDTEKAILELGVGEALVSFLNEKGVPDMVERAWIMPPSSQLPPLDFAQRQRIMAQSLVAGVYEKAIDRESAFERLQSRAEKALDPESIQASSQKSAPKSTGESMLDAFGKSLLRAAGSAVGRQLIRGVLGGLFGGKGR